LFQLFHPMGGVLARPLSSASPKDGAIANTIIASSIRTAEELKRIAITPSKPRNDRILFSGILTFDLTLT
jgi:hypothetical protein